MHYAITINNENIITGVHESLTPITSVTFVENTKLMNDEVVTIIAPNDFRIGENIMCYNENGTRKPNVWCIENGFMDMPPYAEIIDGVLVYREMPPEERPVTLEDYFGNLVSDAKAETKVMIDAVQEEAYRQVTASKESLSGSLAEANSLTAQKFSAMRPLITELVKGKPPDLVICTSEFILPWTEGEYALGDVRLWDGQPRKCCQAHDSTGNPTWTPETASLWSPYHAQNADYALPWVQPTGAHDMYKTGESMIWTDGAVHLCKQDTVFSPLEYAAAWEILSQ